MPALFVRKSTRIHAPAAAVWEMFTDPEHNTHWVSEFGGHDGELISDWKFGSAVDWKSLANGELWVTGRVMAVEPYRLLHFTVVDLSLQPYSDDIHGITVAIDCHGCESMLSIMQGNFDKLPNGERYHAYTADVWDRALPIIRESAEAFAYAHVFSYE